MEHLEQYTIQDTPEQREHQLNEWYDSLQEQLSNSSLDTFTQDVDIRQPQDYTFQENLNYYWRGVQYD